MSPSEITCWLFALGCAVFVQNSVKRHAQEHHLHENVKAALRDWIQTAQIHNLLMEDLLLKGEEVQVCFESKNGHGKSFDDMVSLSEELAKRVPVRSVWDEDPTRRKNSTLSGQPVYDRPDEVLDDATKTHCKRKGIRLSKLSASLLNKLNLETGTNVSDLEKILERESRFLPDYILEEISHEISSQNGNFTLDSLQQFVQNGSAAFKRERQLAIARRCVRSFDFWANWAWPVGSGLFITGVYLVQTGTAQSGDEAVMQLYGWGNIAYFLGGVSQFPTIYKDVYRYLTYRQELERAAGALHRKGRQPSLLRKSVNPFGSIPIKEDFSDAFKTVEEKVGFFELYDQLFDDGVVFPFKMFHSMYNEAEGRVELSGEPLTFGDFTDYLTTIVEEDTSTTQRHWHTVKTLPSKVSFWITLLTFVGGLLFTLASFVECCGSC